MIDKFLDYCRSQRLSVNTTRVYGGNLRMFEKHCPAIATNPNEVTKAHIRSFVEQLGNENVSANTILNKVAAVSSFFDWAVEHEICPTNPTKGVKTPKVPARIPDFIPKSELAERIEAVNGTDFTSLRDRAILELGYAGAMRISELRNANVEDVDIQNMRIRVVGKGDKEAWIQFGENARAALTDYLKYRKEKGPGKDESLFVNANGKRLQTINRIVENRMGKPPHTAFRRSGATHFHMDGASIRAIQGHLRHASPVTTMTKYIGTDDRYNRDQYFTHYFRARMGGR